MMLSSDNDHDGHDLHDDCDDDSQVEDEERANKFHDGGGARVTINPQSFA